MDNWQNLFNRDFYPTPVEVIEQMVGLEDIAGKVVLEPSFGSGNIVKYLNEHHAREVLGCEINDKLRASAQGVRVVGSDFLQLQSEDVSHIDMIIMNPPFSRQEDHILYAWDITPDGCTIITLCNASLLGRTTCYSSKKEQEIANLIELYGHSDYLGNVFKDAERQTEVNVGIIRLYKPGNGKNEFDGYFTDEADEPEAQGNGIITYNFVRDCVNRYVAAVSRVDAALSAGEEINKLTDTFGTFRIQFGAFDTSGSTHRSVTKEVFRKELQKRAWRWIFSKFELDAYVTRSVMEKINNFVEKQCSVPFTMKNIYKMVEMIFGTRGQIMQDVVLDAFDIICKYSDDNYTVVGEKWKTNSAHMVNKKFIVPYMCEGYSYGYTNPTVKLNSYGRGRNVDMDDIVKALCFLTGRPYQWKERDEEGKEHVCQMRTLYEFVYQMNMEWGQWYDWTFFRIKGFKKGTMHVEFQNDDDWALFNIAVAKVRGWELPANVKVKKGGKK